MKLPENYSIREMSGDELRPLIDQHSKAIFEDQSTMFNFYDTLSSAEKDQQKALRENMGKPHYLWLGVFHGQDFAGWHFGRQKDAETFYMQNSAILPAHRRKGLYSALLSETMNRIVAKGFPLITSRHNATNNQVIIPKLKAGFVITGMELSDVFGALVNLTYFNAKLRRKVLDFRVGQIPADAEIRQHLRL